MYDFKIDLKQGMLAIYNEEPNPHLHRQRGVRIDGPVWDGPGVGRRN